MFSKIKVNSRFAGHPTHGGFRMERLPAAPEPNYGLMPADTNERAIADRRDAIGEQREQAQAWWRSQFWVEKVENERGAQRRYQAQLREIGDRGAFDHLAEGWRAASTVIGGAVAFGSMAGVPKWEPLSRTVFAVAAGGVAVAAGYTTGKGRAKAEAARIDAALGESVSAMRRSQREMGVRMAVVGVVRGQ